MSPTQLPLAFRVFVSGDTGVPYTGCVGYFRTRELADQYAQDRAQRRPHERLFVGLVELLSLREQGRAR